MMKPDEVNIQEVNVYAGESIHSFENANNVALNDGMVAVSLEDLNDEGRVDLYLFPYEAIEYVEMKGAKK